MFYNYSTRQIHILVTSACNLRCSYCYESNKRALNCNIQLLKEILAEDFEQNRNSVSDFIIAFHGGEPFLAFEEIKDISEWIWRSFNDRKVKINITTNGTILTEKIKNWCIKNRNKLFVTLSIDGTKEVHDINRSNSYNLIDLEFFVSNWRYPTAKMTVAPNTVHKIYESFLHLFKLGFYPNPSLASYVGWDEKLYLEPYSLELKKLVQFYIENPHVMPGELLDFPLMRFSPTYNYSVKHRCGIGVSRVAYDTSGNKYPCQTFISDFSADYDKERIFEITAFLERNSYKSICMECVGCSIEKICAPCYGNNYSSNGNVAKIEKERCPFTKVSVLASMFLYGQVLTITEKYPWTKNISQHDIYHILQGIREFYKRNRHL